MKLDLILKKLMKEKNLSFKQLASMSGVKRSSLQDWGQGISPRNLDDLKRVAEALNVDFSYLIFGQDAHTKQSVEDVLNSIPTKVIHSGWAKVTIEFPDFKSLKDGNSK